MLVELERRLRPGEVIFDPFAGPGDRLGPLCDRLGLAFAGIDIEAWPDRDPRVAVADAMEQASYPAAPFTVVTSPVYFGNRISVDYVNGPTPRTKRNGRHAYGISLGRALDSRNLARRCRAGHEAEHDRGHAATVACWHDRALVNVDSPIGDRWCSILASVGFTVVEVVEVKTRRLGGVANNDKRAGHEVVIEAVRETGRACS